MEGVQWGRGSGESDTAAWHRPYFNYLLPSAVSLASTCSGKEKIKSIKKEEEEKKCREEECRLTPSCQSRRGRLPLKVFAEVC